MHLWRLTEWCRCFSGCSEFCVCHRNCTMSCLHWKICPNLSNTMCLYVRSLTKVLRFYSLWTGNVCKRVCTYTHTHTYLSAGWFKEMCYSFYIIRKGLWSPNTWNLSLYSRSIGQGFQIHLPLSSDLLCCCPHMCGWTLVSRTKPVHAQPSPGFVYYFDHWKRHLD